MKLCNQSSELLMYLFYEKTVSNILENNVVLWIETQISLKLSLDKISQISPAR